MFQWLRKRITFVGSVLFRGSLPPRAEDFAHLAGHGISVSRETPAANLHWALSLNHPQWGKARLACPRKQGPLPGLAVDWCAGLTEEDKEVARQGGSSVMVTVEGTCEHLLRDRKHALRFLRAVMGDDGLIGWDWLAQRFWPREALADELSHDADLDIEQIYGVHAVGEKDSPQTLWLHSHGLGEIGFFDFDILRPSADVLRVFSDSLRAVAFAIVEGAVGPSTPVFHLASPGGVVRFVPASDFDRYADREEAALRQHDAYHQTNRAVLCEPARSLFGRWSRRVRASRFLSGPFAEGTVFNFSFQATELMAQRALATYPLLRQLAQELAEFDFPVVVKLGYQVDGGEENEREHLWFSVHELYDDHIDATLENQPCAIARFREGQRGCHPVRLLTDWIIVTPAGWITPRSLRALREIRLHRDELRRAVPRKAPQ